MNISLDRNAEIQIQGRIKITVDPPAATGPQVKLTATCGRFVCTHIGATKMQYTLPADKVVEMQIAYVDVNKNPAVVDGEPTWESSDPDIVAVEPASGAQTTLTPGTKVGNCQVLVKADADIGQGVSELVTTMDVTVVAGSAVAGTITPVGEQTPKP